MSETMVKAAGVGARLHKDVALKRAKVTIRNLEFWYGTNQALKDVSLDLPEKQVVTTYIAERFPAPIRATRYGIGYSAAMVIPAFAGFYLLGLSSVMPYVFGPLVLLIIAGLLIITGALFGPETRDVEIYVALAQDVSDDAAIPQTARA